MQKLRSIFLATTISLCSICHAQEAAETALNLIKNQKSIIVLDSLSLPRYEKALIPEFANAIIEQDLVISTIASAPLSFKLDSAWVNSALKGGTRIIENGTASPNQEVGRGPAFGSYEEIIQETDPKILSLKLLWSVVSLLESNRFIDLKLNLSWLNPGSSQSDKVSAQLTASYPAALKLGKAVALREKLKINEPEWLASLSFLTLRQYGNNEDLIWYYSPTLFATRELAGSLRGDLLFNSLFSLDDLLIFSAKPEQLETLASPAFETLVPFVSEKNNFKSTSEASANCTLFSNPMIDSSNPLSSFHLAPRKVFALELKQRDPFSQVGRQKLYVDAATMIPFFREEYAQDGILRKTVVGTFSLINYSNSDPKQIPETGVVPHTIIAFGKAGSISVSKTASGKICSTIPSSLDPKFFEPSHLAPPDKKVPETAAKLIGTKKSD